MSDSPSRDVYFNKKMETLQRNEIAEIQRKQFRSTLIRCLSSSRFYIKEFKKMGLRLEDIQTIEDLQKIGFFTTKEDLRLNYPYGMLAVPTEQVAELHATSGTTGSPTLGLHTRKDLEDWAEISARSLSMSGLTPSDVFQITPSFGLFSGGFGFYHGARQVGCTIVPSGAGYSQRQIKLMMDLGTTMIAAIVSYSLRLAEVASDMGVDLKKDTRVRKGVFGSEMWTRETKRRISSIWDMDPFDIYGFTELYGPGVGNDCKVHDGLHIWEDFFLVEVIDPKTGENVGPEEEGELVFTTLQKEAMPLLRYRSRDISKMLDSKGGGRGSCCECGRTHRRFGEIRGRTDDMVKISGVNFWPSQVEEIVLREEELGPEYRIVISRVKSVDRVLIEVESKDKNMPELKRSELAKRLEKEIRNHVLFSPQVAIVEPNSLPRVEVGKARRVIDERNK